MVWFCFSLSSRCGLHRVGSCSIARIEAEAEQSMGSVQAQGSPPQHQYLYAQAAHCWDTSTLAGVSTAKQSPSWMVIPNRPHSGTEARAHFLAEAARTRPGVGIRPGASSQHYTCGGLWPKWVGPDHRHEILKHSPFDVTISALNAVTSALSAMILELGTEIAALV